MPIGPLKRSTGITGPDGSFEVTYPGGGSVSVTASLRGPFCMVDNAAGADLTFQRSAASGSVVQIEINSSPGELGTAQVNAFLGVNRAHDLVKALDPTFTAIDRPILTQVNVDDSCNAYFIPEGEGFLSFFRSNP